MSQPFRPAPWLAHHHVQPLLPSLGWVRAPDIRWDREVFRLPDSDTVALDWHPLPPDHPPTAELVLLHGLCCMHAIVADTQIQCPAGTMRVRLLILVVYSR